jgi:hypothetical protein
MGRKSVYQIGQMFGKLEILEILPGNGKGNSVKLRCLCHYCHQETMKYGANIKRRNSCGCQQKNSSEWKSKGPKVMPWQLPCGQAARNNLAFQYKKGAERRNLEFNLTIEEFEKIVTGDCYYCGVSLPALAKGLGKSSGDFKYTGIDRKNNLIGYVKYNCVSCCWMCNNMKGSSNEKDFLLHIKKIYEYQFKITKQVSNG